MAYSRGMLDKHLILWNPVEKESSYGKVGVEYKKGRTVWASVKTTRGQRAMNNGNVDVYNYAMIRSDIHKDLTKRSRLECEGNYYIIDSFITEPRENTCQITAHVVNDIQAVEN